MISIAESVPVEGALRNLEYPASLPSTNMTALRISAAYPEMDHNMQLASAVASIVKSQPTLLVLNAHNLWSRGEIVDNLIRHSNLEYLDLFLCFDNQSELRSSLELLARQCPHIHWFNYTLQTGIPQPSFFHAVEPLLSCRLLLQLQIFHEVGPSIGSDDIRQMAQAWRKMETLCLCASASGTLHRGTPLALLLEFAEQFGTRLRRLALNFVFDGELPTADAVWTSFPRLEVLGVGTSKPSTTVQAILIGEFLASICSEQTKLAYITADGWRPDAFDTANWKSAPEASHWVEVATVMDSARRIQKAAVAKALKPSEP